MHRPSGNFGRGYSVMEYILEDSSHTLSGAAKELRINVSTARVDLERVGADAFSGCCYNAEKVKEMYIAAKKQLYNNSHHKPKASD